jgi:FkbM family methyltransferase
MKGGGSEMRKFLSALSNRSVAATERRNSPSGARRPTRTFSEFFAHVKAMGFSPELCIDVGAAAGTPVIYTSVPDALHLAFEPLPEFQEQLRESLKPYRHEIFECALMDKARDASILRCEDNVYGSSLMHGKTEDRPELIPIRTATLDESIGVRANADGVLLKTDCQGSDLFVIKGGLQTLSNTDIAIIESSFFKFWGEHHPDFTEIIAFMYDQGFVVYDILDGLFRPSDNALGQVDLVFVKEHGIFRKERRW